MAADLEDPAALIATVDADPATVATAEPDEKSTPQHLFEPAYGICMFILVSALLVFFFSSFMDPGPSAIGHVAYALGVAGLVIGPCACLVLYAHFLAGNMEGHEQIELHQDRSR